MPTPSARTPTVEPDRARLLLVRTAVRLPGVAGAAVVGWRDGQLRVLATAGDAPEAGAAGLPARVARALESRDAVFGDPAVLPLGADTALLVTVTGETPALAGLVELAASTERAIEAEEQVRVERSRVEALLGAVSGGVLALERDWRIRAMNPQAAALLEVDPEAVVGRTLEEVPALRALGDALRSRRTLAEGENVALPGKRLRVRLRPHVGGSVVHLEEPRRAATDTAGLQAKYTFDDLVGQDPRLVATLRSAMQAAQSDVPILVTGESGTGKELLAQAIHNASPRSEEPFVAINVAAIPADLLESELFGYEAGAFTGADAKGRPGKFELAGSGTILLDEIGEMPLEMQSKLLRVLQEQVVHRLGASRGVPIRARVIATTNRDMEQAVEEGRFRLDLYYRLRVVTLYLPPLRKRRGDIPLLLEHALDASCERVGRAPVTLAPHVMAQLVDYEWRGNVRELVNLVSGIVSLLPPDVRRVDELPVFASRPEMTPMAPPVRRRLTPMTAPEAAEEAPAEEVVPLEALEKGAIARALEAFQGNISRAAEALEISRTTLYAKLKRYGLDKE